MLSPSLGHLIISCSEKEERCLYFSTIFIGVPTWNFQPLTKILLNHKKKEKGIEKKEQEKRRGERDRERQNGDVRGGERKNYNTYLSIPQVPYMYVSHVKYFQKGRGRWQPPVSYRY